MTKDVIKFVVFLCLLGIVVWGLVSAAIFHADNMALCDKLGGSYNAWDGTGQCIKDQVILFDPAHDYHGSSQNEH